MIYSCDKAPMRVEMENVYGFMRPILYAVVNGEQKRFMLEEVNEKGTPVIWECAPMTAGAAE